MVNGWVISYATQPIICVYERVMHVGYNQENSVWVYITRKFATLGPL